MPAPKPKTNAQVRRIFGLAKQRSDAADMDVKEYLEDVIRALTDDRVASVSKLSFEEANDAIRVLGGTPISGYGQSKRSENYRKQKAGIKTIETDAHLTKIRDLAALRNMGDEGIAKLAERMHLPWPPNTTEQGNKLVEALKSMNQRDGLISFPVRTASGSDRVSSTPEPSFRRVA